MIKLVNVTKYYNIKKQRHFILKDMTYTFPENKSIGLLGANGAGKSTLLRLLGGIEYPNSGKIQTDCSISWPVGLSSGFQGSLSATQNIKFVCQIYNKTPAERKRITEFVREFAEIGKFFDMPVKTYSSGMKSRVNFGLSMAFDFDYYLVDEVTGVGDASFKSKAKAEFDKKREKSNIIMVSHSMGELKKNVDIGVLLKDGHFTVYEDIDDAIAEYKK
ncbi:capsular polysaccharide transport system ATP-binding protein [Allofrancisella inopinata]|uniref:ABC transporter ATP-binding protein n=1 Tax=Allofrancisella inopinata TaxID=1085647 RepID=A0AAE7CR13_9GAMM|nr:ABC transporter ATP-binding protein [Allofrancisella inopinata]QIV96510.1 ABC transporter ATP-binding protein [Allofrancisella inopinata]TDT68495.1 capsular polysaccharide transport system ATP-binding protein [Allofrancisella inopinata]